MLHLAHLRVLLLLLLLIIIIIIIIIVMHYTCICHVLNFYNQST